MNNLRITAARNFYLKMGQWNTSL